MTSPAKYRLSPESPSKRGDVISSPRLRGELEGGGFGSKEATTRDLFTMELAKELRHEMTNVERKLWKALSAKKLGYKFRRQQAIGEYIVDFVCMDKKLVIELDGGQHAEIKTAHDKKRTDFLNRNGYTVLRFWNSEVIESLEGVVGLIGDVLNMPPSPNPSRKREGDI